MTITEALHAKPEIEPQRSKRRFAKHLQPEVIPERRCIADDASLKLIEIIDANRPNGQFPEWTKELSTHLQRLDDARKIYEWVFMSYLPENRSDYTPETQVEHRKILKEFQEFSKSAPTVDPEEPIDPSIDSGVLRKYLVKGAESQPIILNHAQNWVRIYLENARVLFTPEIEEFVQKTAEDITNVIKEEDKDFFPEVVEERIVKGLRESEMPISLIKFKRGEIQKTVAELLSQGVVEREEIRRRTGLSPTQIQKAIDCLKDKGEIQRLSPEQMREARSEDMQAKSLNEEFQAKRKAGLALKRKEMIDLTGSYHSLETRMKMSSSRNGLLIRMYPWAVLDLSNFVIAQIIEEPSVSIVKDRLVDMRRRGYIRKLNADERTERLRKWHKEIIIDKKVKDDFVENSDNAQLINLPLAQRIVFDLLPKLYPQVELTLEEKEEMAAETASIAIQDYDPNGKMGFHAHVIKRTVQRLTHCQDFLFLVK